MNNIIKQSIIIITCFFLILWFQDIDDKKVKRIRKTFYDKYKIPIIVCSIVGLLLNINLNENIFNQIFGKQLSLLENLQSNNLDKSLNLNRDIVNSQIGTKNIINPTNQEIYTDMPPF